MTTTAMTAGICILLVAAGLDVGLVRLSRAPVEAVTRTCRGKERVRVQFRGRIRLGGRGLG